MSSLKLKLGMSNGITVGKFGYSGGAGDTTAPSVSTFTLTTPSTSRDVPITAFTASEAGVYFIVTESSTPPAVGAAGWNLTAPTTYTVATDGTFTLYPWVKDSSGNISSVFGSPRTVVVLALPFSDAFTRADGAIGGQWTGATWTIATNATLNTPVAGSELVSNGNMETGDPPTGWNAGANTTLDGVADERTGGGGAQALSVVNAIAAYGVATQQITVAAGTWLTASGYLKVQAAKTAYISISPFVLAGTSTSWTGKSGSVRVAANPTINLLNGENTSGQDGRFDDVSFKPLTLTQLFAYLPAIGVASVTAQVLVTVNPGNFQAGLIINLDSTSLPQNFVIAYLSAYTGTMKAYLDKCVAGTYSNIAGATGNVTYNSASNLKLVKNGDDYSLYYGSPGSETQVGTTQAITGMTGTIHGLFSTAPTPKFDTYQLAATP